MSNLFSEFECKSDSNAYPVHTHTGYQLIYIKTGSLSLEIGERITAEAPAFVFFNNLEPHSIGVLHAETERYVMNINAKAAGSLIKNNILLSVFSSGLTAKRVIALRGGTAEFEQLLAVMLAQYNQKPHLYNELLSTGLKMLLIRLYQLYPENFNRFDSRIESIVFEIKQTLESEPQQELSIRLLSARYCFNEFYLTHSFKAVTGYSIKQYQMLCRTALARELLVHTDKSVTDICFDAGFTNSSNFSRYFKSKTGLTPQAYRKRFKEA